MSARLPVHEALTMPAVKPPAPVRAWISKSWIFVISSWISVLFDGLTVLSPCNKRLSNGHRMPVPVVAKSSRIKGHRWIQPLHFGQDNSLPFPLQFLFPLRSHHIPSQSSTNPPSMNPFPYSTTVFFQYSLPFFPWHYPEMQPDDLELCFRARDYQ